MMQGTQKIVLVNIVVETIETPKQHTTMKWNLDQQEQKSTTQWTYQDNRIKPSGDKNHSHHHTHKDQVNRKKEDPE